MLWRSGQNLKVDRTTSFSTRRNFARIYIEVDLPKPLLSKFKLRRRVRRIVYERLHLLCFQCGGQHGNKKEICPHLQHHSANESEEQQSAIAHLDGNRVIAGHTQMGTPAVKPVVLDSYGEWMVE